MRLVEAVLCVFKNTIGRFGHFSGGGVGIVFRVTLVVVVVDFVVVGFFFDWTTAIARKPEVRFYLRENQFLFFFLENGDR